MSRFNTSTSFIDQLIDLVLQIWPATNKIALNNNLKKGRPVNIRSFAAAFVECFYGNARISDLKNILELTKNQVNSNVYYEILQEIARLIVDTEHDLMDSHEDTFKNEMRTLQLNNEIQNAEEIRADRLSD